MVLLLGLQVCTTFKLTNVDSFSDILFHNKIKSSKKSVVLLELSSPLDIFYKLSQQHVLLSLVENTVQKCKQAVLEMVF